MSLEHGVDLSQEKGTHHRAQRPAEGDARVVVPEEIALLGRAHEVLRDQIQETRVVMNRLEESE